MTMYVCVSGIVCGPMSGFVCGPACGRVCVTVCVCVSVCSRASTHALDQSSEITKGALRKRNCSINVELKPILDM